MARQRATRGWFALALAGCLLVGMPGRAAADDYDDIIQGIADAQKAIYENRADAALKLLAKVLEQTRKFEPQARDYLHEAYYWINLPQPEPTKALQAIDSALSKDAKSAEAYFLKGHIHGQVIRPLTLPNALSAINYLRKSLEMKEGYKQPANKRWDADASWLLFDLLFNKSLNDYELAAGTYRQLVAVEPSNADYQYGLGLAYLYLNSYPQAAAALKNGVDARPDSWQIHLDCMSASRQAFGVKGTIATYVELQKKHPQELAVQLALAELYLDDGAKDQALPLLKQARLSPTLLNPDPKNPKHIDVRSMRLALARDFAKVGQYDEAEQQFAVLLAGLPPSWSAGSKVNITIEYSRCLVKNGKFDMAIAKLEQALRMHRENFGQTAEPLDILFELGNAYYQAGKNTKTKQSDEAEIYFRKYLQQLEKGAQGTRRFAKDVEIAESLGDLYAQDGDYKKAAEVFGQALEIIKYAVDKDKCPTSRVQYKHAKALHDQADWNACIVAAKTVLGDKEHALKARTMLAHAYIENKQPIEAIDQLSTLLTADMPAGQHDDILLLMGQAMLATNRPAEAEKYVKEVFAKRPEDEKTALEYAHVLRLLNKPDEARGLYEKILARAKPKRSAKALIGLGDLEKQLAENATAKARADHLSEAVRHYDEARVLGQSTDPAFLDKLSQTERELVQTRADVDARSGRWLLVLYTGGLILAALIPIGFMVYLYRRQWALHCFSQVCDLERDLVHLIRERVKSRWLGNWDNFAGEQFRGRLDYKSLRNRAERDGGKDILAVANFGHLVGIVDAGWDALGFHDLCAREMADPKEVIVANLSYIGSCRVCLAHFGKLEELAHQTSGGKLGDGPLKRHLSKHLHRQVKTSLTIIRTRFNVTPKTDDLPVLAPLRQRS